MNKNTIPVPDENPDTLSDGNYFKYPRITHSPREQQAPQINDPTKEK